MRMSELGEQAHLTQSALSRLVSRLDRDGLVRRTACDDDRRAIFAELTDEGRARYRAARTTQRRVLREGAEGCPGLDPRP